jgi:hypothetical protein
MVSAAVKAREMAQLLVSGAEGLEKGIEEAAARAPGVEQAPRTVVVS